MGLIGSFSVFLEYVSRLECVGLVLPALSSTKECTFAWRSPVLGREEEGWGESRVVVGEQSSEAGGEQMY